MSEDNPNSQTTELLNHLKSNELFKGFSNEALQKLAANAEWAFLKEGEALFRIGDAADAMYITMTTGLQVTVTKEDGAKIVVAELQPGEIIGELQFLTGGRRTADIIATKDSVAIKLAKSTFDCFGEQKQELITRLNFIIRKRLQFNQLAVILPELFGTLKTDEIKAISKRAEWIQLKRGEVLFKQGDQGDAFYVVINGRLDVAVERRRFKRSQQTKGNEWGGVVGQIGRGESVGEMSLLTDDNHSATVFAFHDSDVFRFSKVEFSRLLEQYPKLLMQITRILVNRLRESDKPTKSKERNSVIVIVPASPEAPLKDFTHRFAKELSALYPTLHLSARELDQELETPGISQITEDDPSNIRLSTWFNSQQEKYRFIILETDLEATNWTKWSVQQADHVLILGECSGDPRLGEIEKKLLFGDKENIVENSHLNLLSSDLAERCLLVLLHPNGDKPPKGTINWLKKRNLEMAHHIRWDSDKDFQRVARHLAGDSIGLALGGGGARGFAHVGVCRALDEAGVPVDMIGGTSMGAILAAFYGMDWDNKKIMSEINANFSNISFDFTLPMTSIFGGAKMSEGLKKFFGEVCIEDLWLPYFCVSSNLSRAEMMVHRSGPLWKGLLASCASPGIFPPVVLGGDLHVDGALLANLPSDVMNRLCNGKVIAVDVSPAVDLVENAPYGDSLSGWKILWSKLNPFVDPISIPGILSILQRGGELASIANQKRVIEKTTDLYLRMPVEKYQLGEYNMAMQIIEEGYQYAKVKIEEWKD